MRDVEQRARAKEFAQYWKDRGYEKGESQPFWMELLNKVYGIEDPAHFILFEEKAQLDHTSFIDGHIPSTHVLIEQKSKGKDLKKPIKQSDGTLLTPFQQAQRYSAALPYSQRPRWIVTCNFEEFLVYDMEQPNCEPESILLKNLPKEYYRLQFLVDTGDENIKREMEVSIKAGRLVGELYDAILKQYHNPEDPHTLKSLNMLCVRLVFCLYAEDAGVFGGHGMFYNYINSYPARDMRKALIDLFRILDTEVRDEYEDEALAQFPYVNGGLFADSDIIVPQFNDEIRDLLLSKASADFDWSDISPTIFGAVFESTLNPETRRSGGMHYTSIENIHKVIDPLFLDELKDEFEEIKAIKVPKIRVQKANAFREKLGSLIFFDPACGSGNFLTETYISLRRLENEAIKLTQGDQIIIDMGDTIKVTIDQFYGIEINDFAVTVAKAALWIAESQMMKETEDIVHKNLDFLPLKSNAYIVEGNALRIDWETVVLKDKLNYIMGNPPFRGHRVHSKEQANDLDCVFKEVKKHGKLDYVAAWFKKAADFCQNTFIKIAFVSTNSICQGESVGVLWKHLVTEKNVELQFAHKTFEWSSESADGAKVHCVIIGFTCFQSVTAKYLFTEGQKKQVRFINCYLDELPNIFLPSRTKEINPDLPQMIKGNEATDGTHLSLTKEEKEAIVEKYPKAEKFIKLYIGAYEFINNKERYCLWLKGVSPAEYRDIPPIIERLKSVKEFRENNVTPAVRKFAETPALFAQIRQPETDYLLVPQTSSQNRRYIPIGYISKEVIANPKVLCVENASLYLFGVLESNVHMSWMRTVAGRMKSDYSYYPSVYYNFPWPNPTDEQKAKIEQTAQAILDARALYPDCSLADLYDELTMPPELRKAHQENDRAVMKAYGFDIKTTTESSCVAELIKLYQKLVEK